MMDDLDRFVFPKDGRFQLTTLSDATADGDRNGVTLTLHFADRAVSVEIEPRIAQTLVHRMSLAAIECEFASPRR